jgi:hypothetical protein
MSWSRDPVSLAWTRHQVWSNSRTELRLPTRPRRARPCKKYKDLLASWLSSSSWESPCCPYSPACFSGSGTSAQSVELCWRPSSAHGKPPLLILLPAKFGYQFVAGRGVASRSLRGLLALMVMVRRLSGRKLETLEALLFSCC